VAGRRHEIDVSLLRRGRGGDLEIALLLMGMGLRTLSVTGVCGGAPQEASSVRVSMTQCERMARKAFSFDSDVQVAAYLRDRARKIVPEAFDGRAVEDEGLSRACNGSRLTAATPETTTRSQPADSAWDNCRA
jgi:hypothetical protein